MRFYGRERGERVLPLPSLEQDAVISSVRDGHNTIIVARAGAGKTTTALLLAQSLHRYKPAWVLEAEAIKSLAPHTKGWNARVLLIPYNRTLKEETRVSIDAFGLSDNVACYNWHSLGKRHYSMGAPLLDGCFTETGLVELFERDSALIPSMRPPPYHTIVVDEAQDMTIVFYAVLQKFMRDLVKLYPKLRPRLVLVGDPRQLIFAYQGADARYMGAEGCEGGKLSAEADAAAAVAAAAGAAAATDGDEAAKAVALSIGITSAGLSRVAKLYGDLSPHPWRVRVLSMTYRLTPEIAAFVSAAMLGRPSTYILSAKSAGPPVRYLLGNPYHNAVLIGREIVDRIEAGTHAPGDIFVLVPSIKSGSNKAPHKQLQCTVHDLLEERGYVPATAVGKPLRDNADIVIGNLASCKGLERRLVYVLGFNASYMQCFHKGGCSDECPQVLYVAATRAAEELVLSGHWREEKSGEAVCHPLPFLSSSPLKQLTEGPHPSLIFQEPLCASGRPVAFKPLAAPSAWDEPARAGGPSSWDSPEAEGGNDGSGAEEEDAPSKPPFVRQFDVPHLLAHQASFFTDHAAAELAFASVSSGGVYSTPLVQRIDITNSSGKPVPCEVGSYVSTALSSMWDMQRPRQGSALLRDIAAVHRKGKMSASQSKLFASLRNGKDDDALVTDLRSDAHKSLAPQHLKLAVLHSSLCGGPLERGFMSPLMATSAWSNPDSWRWLPQDHSQEVLGRLRAVSGWKTAQLLAPVGPITIRRYPPSDCARAGAGADLACEATLIGRADALISEGAEGPTLLLLESGGLSALPRLRLAVTAYIHRTSLRNSLELERGDAVADGAAAQPTLPVWRYELLNISNGEHIRLCLEGEGADAVLESTVCKLLDAKLFGRPIVSDADFESNTASVREAAASSVVAERKRRFEAIQLSLVDHGAKGKHAKLDEQGEDSAAGEHVNLRGAGGCSGAAGAGLVTPPPLKRQRTAAHEAER